MALGDTRRRTPSGSFLNTCQRLGDVCTVMQDTARTLLSPRSMHHLHRGERLAPTGLHHLRQRASLGAALISAAMLRAHKFEYEIGGKKCDVGTGEEELIEGPQLVQRVKDLRRFLELAKRHRESQQRRAR